MCTQRIGLLTAGALFAALWITMPAASQKGDEAEILLRAAAKKELVDGDIKAAIEQYRKIIASHAGNRTIVAKALVALGQCYEKQGNAEARQAYERVVREFSDQAEPLGVARERLGALVRTTAPAPGGGVAHRLVWSTRTWGWGGVSADGRWIAFQADQGDLAIRDLTTGQNRLLTNYGPWSKRPGESYSGVFSPDGKRVAYMWEVYKTNTQEVRVINVDGTGERTLYQHDKALHAFPWAWTPDGTAIVAVVNRTDTDEGQILRIKVADGSVKVLHTGKGLYIHSMAFSPTGRFLAFTARGGIHALDLESPGRAQEPVPLIKDSADNQLMSWSPDGNHILFVSDRSGARDAWLLPVKGGQPAGEPRVVKTGLAMAADSGSSDDIVPMGFTRIGTFYYGVERDTEDAMTVVIDSASGRLEGPPSRFTERFNGATEGPRWSPDGKQAFYQRGSTLFLRNLESTEERELHPQMLRLSRANWHPDGKSLVVIGLSREKQQGVFRVDLDTGAATAILLDREEGWSILRAVLSGDGKVLYRAERKIHPLLGQVVARDLRTGEEKVIHRTREDKDERFIRDLALSPDGKRLASVHGRRKIYVFPVTGDDPEGSPFYPTRPGLPDLFAVAWHPDGRSLLACMNLDFKTGELWRIPVEGGEPEKWPLPFIPDAVDVHPDGRRIGLTAWGHSNEVWALENFLPRETAVR